MQPASQCDGTVDVNLSNPTVKSKYPVTFTVQAGEFTKTVTVGPGKGDTVRVPAGSEPITVTIDKPTCDGVPGGGGLMTATTAMTTMAAASP